MASTVLATPKRHRVKRSELRQKQRETLRLARGNSIVEIAANDEEEVKLLLDKKYFEAVLQKLRSAAETLEIVADQKLFRQILSAAEHLEEDARRGKLHSFEEAFGES